MDAARDLQNSPRLRTVGRREFLGVAGASALSLKMGILDFASSLFAGEAPPARKPRVQVVFVRPEGDRYWMSWPGASYDVEARQAEYTKTLVEAAKKLGVELEVRPLPLDDADAIAAFTRADRQIAARRPLRERHAPEVVAEGGVHRQEPGERSDGGLQPAGHLVCEAAPVGARRAEDVRGGHAGSRVAGLRSADAQDRV